MINAPAGYKLPNVPPMSHREMDARLTTDFGPNHRYRGSAVKLQDGSTWQFDAAREYWVCTRTPDSTGQFKLMAGAL